MKLIGKRFARQVYRIPACTETRPKSPEFFAALDQVEDVTVFEPREFIEAGENVTVLGYSESTVRDTKLKVQTEWGTSFHRAKWENHPLVRLFRYSGSFRALI